MQVVTLIDDMDKRTKAENTVRFNLDGTDYEIDLSPKHERQLREALAAYVAAARRQGTRKAASQPKGRRGAPRLIAVSGNGTISNADVRAWAKANGLKVNDRGRIAAEVVDQFHAAQRRTAQAS